MLPRLFNLKLPKIISCLRQETTFKPWDLERYNTMTDIPTRCRKLLWTLDYVSSSDCDTLFPGSITHDMFCAGHYDGRGICWDVVFTCCCHFRLEFCFVTNRNYFGYIFLRVTPVVPLLMLIQTLRLVSCRGLRALAVNPTPLSFSVSVKVTASSVA